VGSQDGEDTGLRGTESVPGGLSATPDAGASAAFDLIGLDLILPDGRGIRFLRQVRARGRPTPVITSRIRQTTR